jgi:uncharacterized phage-associated protein
MDTIYSVNQIADFFLGRLSPEKGDSISPLKLQKLVYYAQAWHYTIFDKPLFNEKIEAWAHGPVVRSLWDRFKSTGKDYSINLSQIEIEKVAFTYDKTYALLCDINRIYGEHSGAHLEALTHSEMPWIIARGNTPPHAASNVEITLESMKTFYSKLRNG